MAYFLNCGIRLRCLEDLTDDTERERFVGVVHKRMDRLPYVAKVGLIIGYSPCTTFCMTFVYKKANFFFVKAFFCKGSAGLPGVLFTFEWHLQMIFCKFPL